VQLQASLAGKGAIDLEVDEFASMTNKLRRKAIVKRDTTNRKKEARIQILLTTKEKKEKEQQAKLVEKEKEEKEKKTKDKGKNKADNGGQIPISSIIDQGSEMQARSQSGTKKTTTLLQLTRNVITHVTQALVFIEDDLAKSKDLILNISIEDVIDDIDSNTPTWYK